MWIVLFLATAILVAFIYACEYRPYIITWIIDKWWRFKERFIK